MRQTRLTILLTLISICSYGQQYNFDLDKVKFKGLGLETTRKIIIEKFGQGKRTETNYECGFFAIDNSKAPYYQLAFNDFKFIGSDKDKFYLHIVDFDLKGKIKIDYGEKQLSGLTTEDDFIKMFGEKISENFVKHPDTEAVPMYSKDSDDGAVFIFKDGRLIKFEYWTPC